MDKSVRHNFSLTLSSALETQSHRKVMSYWFVQLSDIHVYIYIYRFGPAVKGILMVKMYFWEDWKRLLFVNVGIKWKWEMYNSIGLKATVGAKSQNIPCNYIWKVHSKDFRQGETFWNGYNYKIY